LLCGYWKHQETYERWWKGKCLEDGRRIVDVTYFGNAWAGYVVLTLDDGSLLKVYAERGRARPTKNTIKVYDCPKCGKRLSENE